MPRGYRYELHEGDLVIGVPSTFWHKDVAWRLVRMLHAGGANVFQDPGVRSERPRDCRLPDVGVVTDLPAGTASYSTLPGSAFSLVVEIVCENSVNGEYTDKVAWYAARGIAEYWIVEATADRDAGDATVVMQRLDGQGAYRAERTVLLSVLEGERR